MLEVPSKFCKAEKKTFSLQDVRKFLSDEALDPYLMAWQLILIYGFRPGEVYGLQWDDIKPDRIEIKRSLNRHGQITNGKNRNAARTELLIPHAKNILVRAETFKKQNHILSKFVFTRATGKPLDSNKSSREMHDYCLRNNLTDITPYRLRHTLGSLSKSFLTETQLKLVFGHSASMNTDIYVHKLEDDHIEAGKALDQMFAHILA
ncbi:MAG: hypothetical protein EOM06_15310 [Sphingobacteriia bacterium]|nr:hypothetical protein [Sphingobacteriia bacterium]